MIKRLCQLSKNSSFFLFGARATGKSTLLHEFIQNIPDSVNIDLLDPATEHELSIHPERLIERLSSTKRKPSWVFIDEIQKVPKLLDVIHKLIFETKIKFALTGSSARKLKRGNANLLAGRAFSFKLHPFTSLELGNDFSLDDILRWGSLPSLIQFDTDSDKKRYLFSYVQNYIKEEILVEQLIRNIEPFRAFLEVAAQSNTEIINYAKLAREAGIEPKNVERYFSILEDTLLGFFLHPYSKSIRKRQIQSPKFYFFDIGVVNALKNEMDLPVVRGNYAYGKAFEHFIILELIRLNDYYEKNLKFSYLKTASGVEIDLIIEKGKKTTLVEIKSSDHITDDHLMALKTLGQEIPGEKYLLCQERVIRKHDDILICPWQEGIKLLME